MKTGTARLTALVCGWVILLVVIPGVAQEPGSEKEDQQKVDSKAQKNVPAASIDFKKELGLPYPSLGTLGSRIDTARRSHDPVSLAHAASELGVAEGVSGKKARLTSSALLKESAKLAQLRHQADELTAVQRVANQIGSETDLVTQLKKEIALVKEQDKSETAAIRRNEEPTGAPRRVLVNNYTPQYVDVYVNGFMKTRVGPGQSKWFVIEHKWNPTVLKGYGNEDNSTWGPRYIWGRFKTYTWNLN
jgi:hypothetical protein